MHMTELAIEHIIRRLGAYQFKADQNRKLIVNIEEGFVCPQCRRKLPANPFAMLTHVGHHPIISFACSDHCQSEYVERWRTTESPEDKNLLGEVQALSFSEWVSKFDAWKSEMRIHECCLGNGPRYEYVLLARFEGQGASKVAKERLLESLRRGKNCFGQKQGMRWGRISLARLEEEPDEVEIWLGEIKEKGQ